MKDTVSYIEFLNIWGNICKENIKEIRKCWDKPGEYTKIILKNENSITFQVAVALKMNIAYEYYSVDAIYYNEKDCVKNNAKNKTWTQTNGGIWLTKFKIVFEHENLPYGKNGAYQEISHLMNLNSELKVLVTYRDKELINEFIEDLNSIITKDVLDDTPILVIVGYKENNDIIWNGYILKGYLGTEEI